MQISLFLPMDTIYLLSCRIMYTKGICSRESINTLGWYPWLTLHWHLGWDSINTWLTSWSRVNKFSIDAYESLLSTNVDRASVKMSVKCWLSVDQVLIEMVIACQSRCWSQADQGYWSPLDHNAFSTHDFSCIQLEYDILFYSWLPTMCER